MQVVIVGAGVIGSGLAWRLARRGVYVTLVEREQPASGTTGSSFSWFNANAKRPEDYFRLNLAGMQAHHALRAELGAAPWMHEGGNLVCREQGDWVDSSGHAEDLDSRFAELERWDYPTQWLSRAEAQQLEPNVRFDDAIQRFAYFPSEGWIDGPLLARSMARLAGEAGATLRFECEVTDIERQDGRVSAVRLANGERIAADMVVNCAGPWADQIAKMAGRALPLAPTLGFITRVSGAPADVVRRVVHLPHLHIRPDGEGLFALHHYDADSAIAGGEAPETWSEQLLERFGRVVPAARDARVARWTVATRPIPADDRTSAGRVPWLPGYAEIVSHSAITMGALLPALVADELTGGEPSPLLANFRPERFDRPDAA